MAEAITIVGVAAAAAQLLNYARRARDCASDVVNGSRTIDDLVGQVSDITRIVAQMQTVHLEKDCHDCILRCSEKLLRLTRILEKLKMIKMIRKNSLGGRIWVLAHWARKEREVIKLMDNIFDVEFNLLKMNLMIKKSRGERDRQLGSCESLAVQNLLPSRNPFFSGRIDILERLERPGACPNVHARLAIVGLGGIGKSELAIEFAHRLQRQDPSISVLWVRAKNELDLERNYVESVRMISIPDEQFQFDAVHSCRDATRILDAQSKWLLLIDGADSAETLFGHKSIADFLPQSPHGTVVFTSRNADLALQLVGHDATNLINLGPLGQSDAIRLLESISNDPHADQECRAQLVCELECHPLAVIQAAKFIQQKPIDTSGYLRLYRQSDFERWRLLDFAVTNGRNRLGESISQTWLKSFEEIQRTSHFAANLLASLACLHHRAIPYMLFYGQRNGLVDIISAIGILESYSFVSTDQQDQLIHVHPLVHLVLRHSLGSSRALRSYSLEAFRILSEAFPSAFEAKQQLSDGARLFPHAQSILNDVNVLTTNNLQLTSHFARYLHAIGDLEASFEASKLSVHGNRTLCGDHSSGTLEALKNLAVVHQSLGNYEKCQNLSEYVLAYREQSLGHEHPDVLASLNNLGLILQKRGKYREAEGLHRRALDTKERVLGPEHESTIRSLNNFALVIQEQGRYEAAEECLRRAASVRETRYGISHTGTLLSLNNLAAVLQLQTKHSEASMIYSDVFHARESLLGPKHHDTLRSKGNRALNYLQQGDYDNSEVMLREVLEDLCETLGDDHLETLEARANWASALYYQRDLQKASEVYGNVLERRRSRLGDHHPLTDSCRRLVDEIKVELGGRLVH